MNLQVYLSDGGTLALNVWTPPVLKEAIVRFEASGGAAMFIPDLVVSSLYRESIVAAVTEQLNGEGEDWIRRNLVL